MKILTIIGARPQFVKAAIVSRTLQRQPDLRECIVHTGQHYDPQMSQVFFDELEIPQPTCQLQIGSGSHGDQTGRMLAALEQAMLRESPDVVLVYGDTNSTLAGALAAAKLHIPIAHVEAGLRSYNRRMPEEVNRVLTDHISESLFCPTRQSIENLRREGITENVHLVGDVMYDSAVFFGQAAESRLDPLAELGLKPRGFLLMTCHRADNTDDPQRLSGIMRAVNALAREMPVVFPVHPRTRRPLAALGLDWHENLRLIEPASYLEMLILERQAALVLTDSGGMQKEAFILGAPCVTLREETEWTETVETGANVLAGAETERILEAVRHQLRRRDEIPAAGPWYGEGRAAERICQLLRTPLSSSKAA